MTKEISHDSQELFRLLAENVHDFAVFMTDLEGRILSWNPGVENLLGFPEREWVGQHSSLIFTPEDCEQRAPEWEMETALREGRAEDKRWHVRRDGSHFWANGFLMLLKDGRGEAFGFAKIMRDDTAHRATEEDLRRTKARLESALEAGLAGTFYWDIPRDRIVTDENMRRYFSLGEQATGEGVPLEEVLPAIHEDDREKVARALAEAVESARAYSVEYRVKHPEGVRWLSARGQVERDEAGKIVGLPGFSVDVTERKHAEEVLRASEERYRTLFNSIDEGFCVLEVLFDGDGKASDYRFLELNPSFERLTDISAEQALSGGTVRELIPDLEEHWVETYGRVALTGEPIRFENHSEVMGRWFDVYAFRVGRPEERKVALIFKNITARKRADAERERLHRSLEFERARLFDIFTKAPAFVATMRGPEHVFELANPAYYQLVGHRDLIGRTAREAFPDIEGQGFFELLDKVYRTGEPYEGREMTVLLQRQPGGAPEERFVDLLYQPLFEADGSVSGILAHGVDITEQVEARKRAEEANRVKDEFLATLSHELRTPLTSILGWTRLLVEGRLDAQTTRNALETIDRNATAQTQLIEDVLDVSRIISGKLSLHVAPVELNVVVRNAADAVRLAAEAKGIRLRLALDTRPATVSGDATRLQQVAWNLISNAVKFTPKGGSVEVRLERVEPHVEVIVSDTGQGISPDVLPHVFERFRQADSSMNRAHGGLGLGLAIVRHLTEMHGGTVEAESPGTGQGATFRVKLPLLVMHPSRARDVQVANGGLNRPQELHGLRILVADDDDDTRVLIKSVLNMCGAEVTAVSTAREGLQEVERLRPDVLVSDLGMPFEDGYWLIREVRALPVERGGKTPAVALTAYAGAEDRLKTMHAGFQQHLAKPVEPPELVAVVATLAGRNRGE